MYYQIEDQFEDKVPGVFISTHAIKGSPFKFMSPLFGHCPNSNCDIYPQKCLQHIFMSRSPGHFSRVISPRLISLSSHQWEPQENFRLVFQGRFLSKICTSRYKKMYIKANQDQNSWHKRYHLTHWIELGVRDYQCQMEVCSPQPEPTQSSLTNLSRGAYSTKSAWNDQSPTQRGFPAVITNTLVCKKHQGVQQLDNRTLGSSFTLLADKSFNQLTPNLVIFTWKRLLVFNCLPRIKHLSKTQEFDVLEGDNSIQIYVYITKCTFCNLIQYQNMISIWMYSSHRIQIYIL